MVNPAVLVFWVPIVAIIFGTGMITAITVSIIRAVSRSGKSGPPGLPAKVLARLQALEERAAAQDADIKKLQDENAFLVKLLEEGREGD
jgi:NAD(P)H-dependent flavin oxidoreductase YrpB (nitropropane dioxygenase family)